MNVMNLLLHLGAAMKDGEDAVAMIEDLVNKRPVGPDAVDFLKNLGALVGADVFHLPSPLTVDLAESIISQLIDAVQPIRAAVMKIESFL